MNPLNFTVTTALNCCKIILTNSTIKLYNCPPEYFFVNFLIFKQLLDEEKLFQLANLLICDYYKAIKIIFAQFFELTRVVQRILRAIGQVSVLFIFDGDIY